MEENELRFRKECCNVLWNLEHDLNLVEIESKKFSSLVNDFKNKIDALRPIALNVYQILSDIWHSAFEMPDDDLKKSCCFHFVKRIAQSWCSAETNIHSSIQGVNLVSFTNPSVPLRTILMPMKWRLSFTQKYYQNMMIWDSECSIRIRQIFSQIIPQIMYLLDGEVLLHHYIYTCKTLVVLQKKRSVVDDFLRHVLCATPPSRVAVAFSVESPHVRAFAHVMLVLSGTSLSRPQREPLCLAKTPLQEEVKTLRGRTIVVKKVGKDVAATSTRSGSDLELKWTKQENDKKEEPKKTEPSCISLIPQRGPAQDAPSVPYYLEFMDRWPTSRDLSSCSIKVLSPRGKKAMKRAPGTNDENVNILEVCDTPVEKVESVDSVVLGRTRSNRMPLTELGESEIKRRGRQRPRGGAVDKQCNQQLNIKDHQVKNTDQQNDQLLSNKYPQVKFKFFTSKTLDQQCDQLPPNKEPQPKIITFKSGSEDHQYAQLLAIDSQVESNLFRSSETDKQCGQLLPIKYPQVKKSVFRNVEVDTQGGQLMPVKYLQVKNNLFKSETLDQQCDQLLPIKYPQMKRNLFKPITE